MLIKNHRGIQSIKDAQSFRHQDGIKLAVAGVDAHVYHYGWVRPPELMQRKKKVHDGLHRGLRQAEREYADRGTYYDYGPLGRIPMFKGSHPGVMKQRISEIHWKNQLNYTGSWIPDRPLHKHEKWRYRAISWMENHLLQGRQLFGYQNWKLKH